MSLSLSLHSNSSTSACSSACETSLFFHFPKRLQFGPETSGSLQVERSSLRLASWERGVTVYLYTKISPWFFFYFFIAHQFFNYWTEFDCTHTDTCACTHAHLYRNLGKKINPGIQKQQKPKNGQCLHGNQARLTSPLHRLLIRFADKLPYWSHEHAQGIAKRFPKKITRTERRLTGFINYLGTFQFTLN